MSDKNKQSGPNMELWLLLIPISIGGGALIWSRYGFAYGLSAGLLTFGLLLYCFRKKK